MSVAACQLEAGNIEVKGFKCRFMLSEPHVNQIMDRIQIAVKVSEATFIEELSCEMK